MKKCTLIAMLLAIALAVNVLVAETTYHPLGKEKSAVDSKDGPDVSVMVFCDYKTECLVYSCAVKCAQEIAWSIPKKGVSFADTETIKKAPKKTKLYIWNCALRQCSKFTT